MIKGVRNEGYEPYVCALLPQNITYSCNEALPDIQKPLSMVSLQVPLILGTH